MKRLVADVSDSFFQEVKRYCADHPSSTQRIVVVQGVKELIGSSMSIEEILEADTTVVNVDEGGTEIC